MKVAASANWQSFTTTVSEYVMVKQGAVAFTTTNGAQNDDGIVLDRNDTVSGSTIRVEAGRTIYYRAVREGSVFVREGFA